MPKAAHVFYLAVFALLGTSHGAAAKADECAFEPGAIVSDACASYSDLERINGDIQPYLDKITKETDFFSYWRLNLFNKKCPFWSDENGMCGNIACAVNTLDNEEDIPQVWRAHELGKLEGPKAQHPGRKVREEHATRPLQGSLGEGVGESCVVEYDDECDERDYCVPDDEGASAKGDYVSLVDNPERFTGYAGAGSQQVWEAIYRENCFSKPNRNDGQSSPAGGSLGLGGLSGTHGQAALDLRNVIRSQPLQQSVQSAIAMGGRTAAGRQDQLEFDDECLEKRVFYRVVSGMHASISAHLCWDFLDQTTGRWHPNLECYEKRLHNYPDRISNIYFNYALVLRAVGKLRNHLGDYEFCSADYSQNAYTKDLVFSLLDTLPSNQRESIFDESIMFRDYNAAVLKDDFKHRFRNVSRIMDCVGCDKCRLWGKLQTTGYGTALKVLFEFDDERDPAKAPPLRRTELVALVNTLGRISHSLAAVQQFRHMIEERDAPAAPAAASSQSSTAAPVPIDLPTPLADAYEARMSLDAEMQLQQEKKKKSEEPAVGEDDGYPDFLSKPRKVNPTFSEAFWEEFDLVWRTFCFVIKQWVGFPGKLIKILVVEFSRLWDYWLGLPVKPRSWEFRVPGREEL